MKMSLTLDCIFLVLNYLDEKELPIFWMLLDKEVYENRKRKSLYCSYYWDAIEYKIYDYNFTSVNIRSTRTSLAEWLSFRKSNYDLPKSVTKVITTRGVSIILPDHVEYLEYDQDFQGIIQNLPKNLQELKVSYLHVNHPLPIKELKHLHTIHISGWYFGPLKQTLPPSVKVIRLDNRRQMTSRYQPYIFNLMDDPELRKMIVVDYE